MTSKTAIYAKHGIQYKNGKIITPEGKAICELLKEGNSKTGKRVYTFSMLPGLNGTCACTCEGCYAMTGFYRMNSVIKALETNTELVNNHVEFFKACILAQLEIIGPCEVRIHAAGDFNTKNPDEYAAAWHEIALKNPDCKFWTYTKVTKYESLFDDLNNANIVPSIIPHIGFNFGHCDYIIRAYKYLKAIGESVYICRCGIDKNQHCENCANCSKHKFVLFIEHSTSYKAETDENYNTLVELINSQED